MDLQDITKRVQKGLKVTPKEYAYLLANNRSAFFAFMIANNIGSMNDILRHRLGYSFELGFTPDLKAITRICDTILADNKTAEIRTILNNFQINTAALSPELLGEIKLIFNR